MFLFLSFTLFSLCSWHPAPELNIFPKGQGENIFPSLYACRQLTFVFLCKVIFMHDIGTNNTCLTLSSVHSADSQNVMRTRSGLVISTVPKLRSTASALPSRPACTTPPIGPLTTAPEKPRDPFKRYSVLQRKSLSCLSFVTRFGLIKEGIPYHFTDSESWWDEDTYSQSQGSLGSATDTSSVTSSESEDAAWSEGPPGVMSIWHQDLCPVEKARESSEKRSGKSKSQDRSLEVGGAGNTNSYVYREKLGVSVAQTSQSGPSASACEVKYINIRNPKSQPSNEKDSGKKIFPRDTIDNTLVNTASLQRKLPVSRLAEKHPVLLQCISRDDVSEAAASLLSLAAGKPITSSKATSAKKETHTVGPVKTTRYIMYRTNLKRPAPVSEPPEKSEETAMQGTSDTTEDDDDTSSLASQSSADERFVQQASEVDDAFKQDLSCFQMECHAFCEDASGEKIHRCTICNKVFTILSAFRAHVTTHVRPKNRCNICGKIFSRSWLLKGHIRTHTGERPYTCRYKGCERSFADKSNLRSHTLIHTTKDKAYVCTKCNRAFAQKRYLHKHKLEVCKIWNIDVLWKQSKIAGNRYLYLKYLKQKILPKCSVVHHNLSFMNLLELIENGSNLFVKLEIYTSICGGCQSTNLNYFINAMSLSDLHYV